MPSAQHGRSRPHPSFRHARPDRTAANGNCRTERRRERPGFYAEAFREQFERRETALKIDDHSPSLRLRRNRGPFIRAARSSRRRANGPSNRASSAVPPFAGSSNATSRLSAEPISEDSRLAPSTSISRSPAPWVGRRGDLRCEPFHRERHEPLARLRVGNAAEQAPDGGPQAFVEEVEIVEDSSRARPSNRGAVDARPESPEFLRRPQSVYRGLLRGNRSRRRYLPEQQSAALPAASPAPRLKPSARRCTAQRKIGPARPMAWRLRSYATVLEFR